MLSVLLLLALPHNSAPTLCPDQCSCFLDGSGRNTVACKEGGISAPLHFFNLSLTTEVLLISAPESKPNHLTMSPSLKSYKDLEEVRITHSNIPQLGKHFFYGLSKLDVLDLSQNNISQPLDHNFVGLSHLKELYLDDNRISSLPSGTFRYLQELKVLSMQRNRIAELTPRIFLEIGKLKVLKMSGNALGELNPVVFEDVKELKLLECRFCSLSTINPQVAEHLPHLTHLDLGDNQLTTLTLSDFTPLRTLRTLRLDSNSIATLPHAIFRHQKQLKKLNLARNRLTKIQQDVFIGLHNLTELDLSYNKIHSCSLHLVAETLEILDLSGNHLDVNLRSYLDGLKLTELRLNQCGLYEIHSNVLPDTLEVLELHHNFLTTLEVEVLPQNLLELDLSSNRFMGLNDELLTRLELLEQMKLGGNPWSCDLCYIVAILKRSNRSSTFKNLICEQPYIHQGKKLGALRLSELTWCNIPSSTSPSDANFFFLGNDGRIGLIAAGTSLTLLFVTAAAVLAIFLYSRRHAAKYYTHEEKMAIDGDSILDNNTPLFGDELNFKFEKKLSVTSISTIDKIKKEHSIMH